MQSRGDPFRLKFFLVKRVSRSIYGTEMFPRSSHCHCSFDLLAFEHSAETTKLQMVQQRPESDFADASIPVGFLCWRQSKAQRLLGFIDPRPKHRTLKGTSWCDWSRYCIFKENQLASSPRCLLLRQLQVYPEWIGIRSQDFFKDRPNSAVLSLLNWLWTSLSPKLSHCMSSPN